MSSERSFSRSKKIAIIGSGLIGRSWAMIYAAYGFDVYLYDITEDLIDQAIGGIHEQIDNFSKKSILRGHCLAGMQKAKIIKATSMLDCVSNALHIQECVPENLELKKKVFTEIDSLIQDNVVVASSTSCFLPTSFTENLKHRSQMLVAHPVNPPYFVPLVELIPSSWTEEKFVKQTHALLISVGQKPVTLKKEIPGFIVNRIQYVILNECYRLIRDDVISVEDVDSVMSDGLGMRYAFMGPWETAHLNAPNGLKDYFQRYAQGIYDVSKDMGPAPFMEGETAKKISDSLLKKVSLAELKQRQKWRDEKLIALSKLKDKTFSYKAD